MHVGAVTACSQCASPLWAEWAELEPISGLLIHLVACLRCGAAFLFATAPAGVQPREEDEA